MEELDITKNKNLTKRITLYGSAKDIKETKSVLETHINELTGNEGQDRLIIQSLIDHNKLKADILYDGNTVWSYDKTIKDFKNLLKNGMESMSDYMYEFLSLETGSAAHFNKQGWIETYPTINDLKEYFKKNEYGQTVLEYQPAWATDRIKIIKEMLRLLKIK
ncbi:MAG: hypothetical protein QXP59_04010 [Saccharolobus sp.]